MASLRAVSASRLLRARRGGFTAGVKRGKGKFPPCGAFTERAGVNIRMKFLKIKFRKTETEENVNKAAQGQDTSDNIPAEEDHVKKSAGETGAGGKIHANTDDTADTSAGDKNSKGTAAGAEKSGGSGAGAKEHPGGRTSGEADLSAESRAGDKNSKGTAAVPEKSGGSGAGSGVGTKENSGGRATTDGNGAAGNKAEETRESGSPGDDTGDKGVFTSANGFKDIQRQRKIYRKKHPFADLFIIIVIIAGCIAFLLSPALNVRKIRVEGNSYYSDSEVADIANVGTGVNIFRGVSSSGIKKRLLANPYFTEVSVRRALTGTLTIKVKERKQTASLKYGVEYIVIDNEGTVLRKTAVYPKLTILKGLTLSEIKTGEKLRVEQSETLKDTLSMLDTMEKGDFYFKEIEIGKFLMTASITDTLKVEGSPVYVESAIKNGDLQKVVNRLFKEGVKRGTITVSDSRYMSFSPVI